MDENVGYINQYNHVGNNRPDNKRIILGQIYSKSGNHQEKAEPKKKAPLGLQQRNCQAAKHVGLKKPAVAVKTSKTCKSEFQIYCDEPLDENVEPKAPAKVVVKKNEEVGSIDVAQGEANDCRDEAMQNDHVMGIQSLALDESAESLPIDLSCNESMVVETDEEGNSTGITSDCSEMDHSYTSFDALLLARCKDYSDDIQLYLMERERKNMPDPFYMSKQPEINTKMRSILVDWMVEVTIEYKLLDETVFLAVNYIDRFLSKMSVARQTFQLLGTAALFISSKYEEIYPPDINEFVFITDDAYSKEQILTMEKLILKTLKYDLSTPTTYYFLEKLYSSLSLPSCVKHLAEYYCYLTMLDSELFLQFYPSDIAVAALVLSCHTLGYEDQITQEFIDNTMLFENKTNGDIKTLKEERRLCLLTLHKFHSLASSHPQQAIQQKYSSDKYNNASLIEPHDKAPCI